MTVTSKDVFAKRKAGELDAAYQLGLVRMGAADKNEWDDRAFGWCLIDLIKRDVAAGQQMNLQHYRQQLEALIVPAGDDILTKHRGIALDLFDPAGQKSSEARQLSKSGQHAQAAVIYRQLARSAPDNQDYATSLGWELYRTSKSLLESSTVDAHGIKRNLNEYLSLCVERPSLLHSVMLQIASKLAGQDKLKIAAFCRLWQLEYLREEDWAPFRPDEGKVLPSLAERVLQQAGKDAAKGNDPNIQGYILPYLDEAVDRCAENIWLKWNKAKLLFGVGRQEEALTFAIEVAKEKLSEYWVWELLGDIAISSDPGVALSCYCKALTCSSDDKFVVKVREKLVPLLVAEQKFSEAKFELERIHAARQEGGGMAPTEVTAMLSAAWYDETCAVTSNSNFYQLNLTAAEELLFRDLPWIPGNIGETFTVAGKQGGQRKLTKLYIQNGSIPLEETLPANRVGLKGITPGTPIRIKGERDALQRFKLYMTEIRESGEVWDACERLLGVVDNVNRKKQVVHVLVSKSIDAVVPISDLPNDINEGDVVVLRLARYNTQQGVRHRVLFVEKSTKDPSTELRKAFKERVEIADGGFGFTESNVFIPPFLVTGNNLESGDEVEGIALLSFNKKRGEWGYKAISAKVGHQ